MSEHDPKGALDRLLSSLENPDCKMGQIFGKPCIKLGRKTAIAAFRGDLVFKLAHPEGALALEGAHLWDPSGTGRAMKAWVVVPTGASEMWPALGQEALDGL